MRRPRGPGGRFLTAEEIAAQKMNAAVADGSNNTSSGILDDTVGAISAVDNSAESVDGALGENNEDEYDEDDGLERGEIEAESGSRTQRGAPSVNMTRLGARLGDHDSGVAASTADPSQTDFRRHVDFLMQGFNAPGTTSTDAAMATSTSTSRLTFEQHGTTPSASGSASTGANVAGGDDIMLRSPYNLSHGHNHPSHTQSQ